MFNETQKKAMRRAVAKLVDVKLMITHGQHELVETYRALHVVIDILSEEAWLSNEAMYAQRENSAIKNLIEAREMVENAISYPENHGYGSQSRQPVVERINAAIVKLQSIYNN